MSNQKQPTDGEQFGPCAICGQTAMPKYGVFLCTKHGQRKYAQRVKDTND